MRQLIGITFTSLYAVMDAPDIAQEARPYFSSGEEQDYQKNAFFECRFCTHLNRL